MAFVGAVLVPFHLTRKNGVVVTTELASGAGHFSIGQVWTCIRLVFRFFPTLCYVTLPPTSNVILVDMICIF